MDERPHFELLTPPTPHSARAGRIITPHAIIPTPAFIPVATQASVKTLTPEEVEGLGYTLILANTYHLSLRPGIESIRELGGLHHFMSWRQALITDSGGYQVFSLSPLTTINDEGITFRSHIDGRMHVLSPELAIGYQESLGSDIMMVLDDCPPVDASPARIATALSRTHRWARRSLKARSSPIPLYAIVQGGLDHELRAQSAAYLVGLGFDGYAIGGLSLGEAKEATYATIAQTTPLLPPEKPRYLMGVGAPEDIVQAVARGIDIMDSALPTRVGRNGGLYTRSGRINILQARYARLDGPVDSTCGCYTCRHFSAAYLHHLFRSKELLGLRLASLHNLAFLSSLMQEIREAIKAHEFARFQEAFLATYQPTDEEVRLKQKRQWLKGRLL